jgi:hypothetical protein
MSNPNQIPDSIRALLDKYYKGETTLAEEKTLKDYFGPLAIEGFNAETVLFSLRDQKDPVAFPNELLWQRIHGKPQNAWLSIGGVRRFVAYAASITIAITIGIWAYNRYFSPANPRLTDTYQDPAEAYSVAMKYLGFVSSKLAVASNQMKPLERIGVPEAALSALNHLDRGIRPVEYFDMLGEPVRRIEDFSTLTGFIVNNNN